MNLIERACPFCRADKDHLALIAGGEMSAGDYRVRCGCCGAVGPCHVNPLGAMLLWNGAAAEVFERMSALP